MRWRIVKDLAEQGAECSSGGSSKADAGLTSRPDCNIDGRVEEVGDIVKAIDERQADNSRWGTTSKALVYNTHDDLRL